MGDRGGEGVERALEVVKTGGGGGGIEGNSSKSTGGGTKRESGHGNKDTRMEPEPEVANVGSISISVPLSPISSLYHCLLLCLLCL
jgi:hypothetical protein